MDLAVIEEEVTKIKQMDDNRNSFKTKEYAEIPLYITELTKLKEKTNKPETVKTRYIKGYREYYIVESKKWVPSMTSVLGILPKPGLDIWKAQFTATQYADYMLFVQRLGEAIHYQVADCMLQYFGTDEAKAKATQEVPAFIYTAPATELALYQTYLLVTAEMVRQFIYIYQNRIRLLDIETFCYNKELGYGGRFDLLFEIFENGRWVKCIGDIKTSKALYPTVPAQLTGYQLALASMNTYHAERLYELRFHPSYDEPDDLGWEMVILKQDIPLLTKARDDFYLADNLKKQAKKNNIKR